MTNFLKVHLNYLFEIVVMLVFILIVFKLLDLFDKKMKQAIIERSNNLRLLRFSSFLTKFLKFLLVFIVIATILQNHGYSVTSLLTGVGITGLIVGFAAKEAIANVLGSVAILSDNIYNIGDYIIVGQDEGTVEEINLRSTKIRTLENILTVIPNNLIANTIVKNVSAINKRRLNETFGIVYDTSEEKLDNAIEILKEILKQNHEVDDNYSVFLEKFDSSSINIKIFALVNHADLINFKRVRQDVLKSALKQFRQAEINFALPSKTVYLKNEN